MQSPHSFLASRCSVFERHRSFLVRSMQDVQFQRQSSRASGILFDESHRTQDSHARPATFLVSPCTSLLSIECQALQMPSSCVDQFIRSDYLSCGILWSGRYSFPKPLLLHTDHMRSFQLHSDRSAYKSIQTNHKDLVLSEHSLGQAFDKSALLFWPHGFVSITL